MQTECIHEGCNLLTTTRTAWTLWATSAPWTLRARVIAWSLAGDDAEDFDITGGVLSFKKSPNFEDPMGVAGWRNSSRQQSTR